MKDIIKILLISVILIFVASVSITSLESENVPVQSKLFPFGITGAEDSVIDYFISENINDVIRDAQDGDIIVIKEGFYFQQLLISNKQNITIQAQGEVWFVTDDWLDDVIIIEGSSNVIISGINGIHNVDPGRCEGDVYDISGSNRILITDAIMNGSGAFGLNIDRSYFCVIESNLVLDCSYGFMSMENSHNIVVRYNVITNSGYWLRNGLPAIESLYLTHSEYIFIEHNTFANNRFLSIVNNIISAKVTNNIFYRNQTCDYDSIYENTETINLIYEPDCRMDHLFPVDFPENVINEDPLFVDPENMDFTLRENSPAQSSAADGVYNLGAFPANNSNNNWGATARPVIINPDEF